MSASGPVVIGIGNLDRSDDACGRIVARRLRGRLTVRVEESEGDAADLLELWSGATTTVLVDAMCSGASPGTVCRVEWGGDGTSPRAMATSTHGLGLEAAWGLGQALGRAPAQCVVFGIEALSLAAGRGLSAPVERAVTEVAGRIVDELGSGPADCEPEGGRDDA